MHWNSWISFSIFAFQAFSFSSSYSAFTIRRNKTCRRFINATGLISIILTRWCLDETDGSQFETKISRSSTSIRYEFLLVENFLSKIERSKTKTEFSRPIFYEWIWIRIRSRTWRVIFKLIESRIIMLWTWVIGSWKQIVGLVDKIHELMHFFCANLCISVPPTLDIVKLQAHTKNSLYQGSLLEVTQTRKISNSCSKC